MEFKGQYLTYNEYRQLGGDLTQMPFNLIEFQVRKEIDSRTMNRLVGVKNIPNDVKFCINELINDIKKYAFDKGLDLGKTSESTDGYSVSYASATDIQEIIKTKKQEISEKIETQLFGVFVNGEHLIYSGL